MQCNNELMCVCFLPTHTALLCLHVYLKPAKFSLFISLHFRLSPDKYPPPPSQSSEERPHLVLVVRYSLILAPHAGLMRAIQAELTG